MENKDFLEELQMAIMNANGRFFKREELINMKLGDVIKNFEPNGIYFSVNSNGN